MSIASNISTSPRKSPVKKIYIPSIILSTEEWLKCAKPIMESIPKDSLIAKLAFNQVKLQVDSITTFRLVQKKLFDLKSAFHRFSLAKERTLNVLLRGIPSSSEDAAKQELLSLGFEPNFICQFVKNGCNLPMFMVSLPNNHENKSIFNLHSLFIFPLESKRIRPQVPPNATHAKASVIPPSTATTQLGVLNVEVTTSQNPAQKQQTNHQNAATVGESTRLTTVNVPSSLSKWNHYKNPADHPLQLNHQSSPVQ